MSRSGRFHDYLNPRFLALLEDVLGIGSDAVFDLFGLDDIPVPPGTPEADSSCDAPPERR